MNQEQLNIVTLTLSCIALVASIYSALQYRNANVISKRALKLQEAALESQITNSIATATVQLREALMKYAEADSSAVNYPIISKNYNSAQETWLNAYDQACMSYREGKLNKETFKKTYHVPIRELYEDKELQFFFSPADTSKYQSIISVYREWETYNR
ncbi:TPA: hypothetical protein ACMEL9_003025 [Klebsiella variicola subsp. variicola]